MTLVWFQMKLKRMSGSQIAKMEQYLAVCGVLWCIFLWHVNCTGFQGISLRYTAFLLLNQGLFFACLKVTNLTSNAQ